MHERSGDRSRAPKGDFSSGGDAIVASATGLFQGTYYQWGGITPWGADCSGMVQTVFALHGVKLLRDAWQQATQGVLLEGGMDAFEAGDLLFFSDRDDGKITHVALAISSEPPRSSGACGEEGIASRRSMPPTHTSPRCSRISVLREEFFNAATVA